MFFAHLLGTNYIPSKRQQKEDEEILSNWWDMDMLASWRVSWIQKKEQITSTGNTWMSSFTTCGGFTVRGAGKRHPKPSFKLGNAVSRCFDRYDKLTHIDQTTPLSEKNVVVCKFKVVNVVYVVILYTKYHKCHLSHGPRWNGGKLIHSNLWSPGSPWPPFFGRTTIIIVGVYHHPKGTTIFFYGGNDFRGKPAITWGMGLIIFCCVARNCKDNFGKEVDGSKVRLKFSGLYTPYTTIL